MARVGVSWCLLALVGVALAGCLAPASQPLQDTGAAGPLRTVGGSATVPDVVADGAEVLKHADAVELVWKGTAPFRPCAPVPGLLTACPPTPAQVVRHDFELPTEVTFAQVNLTWAAGDVMNVFLRNDAGRTQCRAFPSQEDPQTATCQVHLVGARAEPWKMHVDVVGVLVNDPAGGPFEAHLTLSVKPFALLGPALAPADRAPAMTFFNARVDEERRTGEPSIKVDDQGVVYVAAPTGRMTSLWQSKDNGATFEFIDMEARAGPTGQAWSTGGRGGGDAEVYVTPDGKDVYFADLWGNCMSVGASHDAAATWEINPLSCDLPIGQDRQWLWAQPGGHLWMTMNGANAKGIVGGIVDPNAGGLYVLHSIDGGRTWIGRDFIAEDNCARGNIVVTERSTFVAGCNDEGPGVAAWEGGAYVWHNVAKRSGEPLAGFCYVCGIFTVIDADTEGNLYVVWADPSQDEQGFDIWMATSQDDAKTWSAPVLVNHADGNAVQPWIAAREPGHVAVAWYQTMVKGSPDKMTEGEWYTHLAESWDALAPAPRFAENLVSDAPVQFGPICLTGSACVAARNLLDFLMVDIDAQGKAHVAYIDGSMGGAPGNSFVLYARQLGDAPAAAAKPAGTSAPRPVG